MGSAHSVWATLGLPPLTACMPSVSTLLRLQVALQGNCRKLALGCVHFPGLSHSDSGSWVLHKGTDSVGTAFCALPRSGQLRRPGAWWAHSPSWVMCLITAPVPAALFPGCAAVVLSQVCCVLWDLLSLLWGADLWLWLSWQMSTSQNPRKTWLAMGNLLTVWWKMPSLGPSLPLAFWLWLSATYLSASRGGWASLALLWYSLSPLFCEQAGSALG